MIIHMRWILSAFRGLSSCPKMISLPFYLEFAGLDRFYFLKIAS